MNTRFAVLATLEVTHTYYDGLCRDFAFVLPGDTTQLLKRRRLIAKALDGRLHLLFEAAESGGPLVSATGTVVRVGLRLANSAFGNFTTLASVAGGAVAVYDNAADAAKLGAPKAATLTGAVFAHTLDRADRPADVTLKNGAGSVAATHTVTAANTRPSVSFDLTGREPGVYTAVEDYPGGVTKSTVYYLDPELSRESLFGIVEITIADAMHAAPPSFQITFEAREDTLKYYVVASNYALADFNALDVADVGFGTDNRPQITFTKVAPAAFTAADIPAALLASPDQRIVMFRSNAPVKRLEQGRRRIELRRNGDVMVGNLPQPGPAHPAADLIVHLSKPKP